MGMVRRVLRDTESRVVNARGFSSMLRAALSYPNPETRWVPQRPARRQPGVFDIALRTDPTGRHACRESGRPERGPNRLLGTRPGAFSSAPEPRKARPLPDTDRAVVRDHKFTTCDTLCGAGSSRRQSGIRRGLLTIRPGFMWVFPPGFSYGVKAPRFK